MVLDQVKQILAEYKGIDKAIIQPETTMAVSYTHLDVYKRQLLTLVKN